MDHDKPDTRRIHVIERLTVCYSRFLKDTFSVDSVRLVIPVALRFPSDDDIPHFCTAALATLAQYDTNLPSFQRRLKAEAQKSEDSGFLHEFLTAHDAVSAVETFFAEQDALKNAVEATASADTDTNTDEMQSITESDATQGIPDSDFVPDAHSLPSLPDDSASAPQPENKRQLHHRAPSASVPEPAKKKTRTSTRHRSGVDVQSPKPTIVKDAAEITDVDAITYPIEVAVPWRVGEYREIEDPEDMREFLEEKEEQAARAAARSAKKKANRRPDPNVKVTEVIDLGSATESETED